MHTDIVADALEVRYSLTVEDFHKMGKAGIFDEDERIELINGDIIEMTPIGFHHARVVRDLINLMVPFVKGKAVIDAQNPIMFGQISEPQPDICVLRPRQDGYRTSLPTAEDVLLIIEVADTSYRYDREVKIPLYARHMVPEIWLLDLNKNRVEVYSKPEEGEYHHVDYHRKGQISSNLVKDIVLDVSEIF